MKLKEVDNNEQENCAQRGRLYQSFINKSTDHVCATTLSYWTWLIVLFTIVLINESTFFLIANQAHYNDLVF